MREQIKLYLCNEEGQRFFGEGPYQLLRCIERWGSLRSAAQEMNMAYTKAFHLIRHAEEEPPHRKNHRRHRGRRLPAHCRGKGTDDSL